jgi:hypothetical protein
LPPIDEQNKTDLNRATSLKQLLHLRLPWIGVVIWSQMIVLHWLRTILREPEAFTLSWLIVFVVFHGPLSRFERVGVRKWLWLMELGFVALVYVVALILYHHFHHS